MSRTTRWTSEGVPVFVTTTIKPGESVEDFRARHELRVAQARIDFPEDAGTMVRSTIWTWQAIPRSTYTARGTAQSYEAFRDAHDARNDLELDLYPPDLEAA